MLFVYGPTSHLKCSRRGVRASFGEMLAKYLVHGRMLWCAGGMFGLTLSARREIKKKEAGLYMAASKKPKGVILDRLAAEVG